MDVVSLMRINQYLRPIQIPSIYSKGQQKRVHSGLYNPKMLQFLEAVLFASDMF